MELVEIKGLGEKRIKALNGAGIFSPQDLINHFPKKYYDFSKPEGFAEDGAYRLICATLTENPKMFKSRAIKVVTAKASIDGKIITLYFYGQTFLKSSLKEGQTIFAYGKNSPKKHGSFVVSFHKLKENVKAGILPVYKTFEGIGQEIIKKAIETAIWGENIASFMGSSLETQNNLLPLKEAYFKVHFPDSLQDADNGAQRIMLENGLIFAHINHRRKIYAKATRNYCYSGINESIEDFKKIIPFSLTSSQVGAIESLAKDFASSRVANRLIEGDTGSGKTMVAFWAMSLARKNGFQSAMMAPTEILARQHYENAIKLFGEQGIAFLAGSTKPSEKKEIYEKLKTGEIKMIFGTHALFSSGIEFNNLKLAIVDEQHRFGVAERALLAGKTAALDYISLSATPIPRSVSLVLYGGLDVTQMKEKPHNSDIQTNIVLNHKKDDMLSFIGGEIEKGAGVFVVCPKIDDDEEKDSLASTTKTAKELAERFGAENVKELNGKMKDETKNEILEQFKQGKIKVLVSTSVVEVGVDAASASIMVILNPERFGLASLHQLRGRIGRKGQKAYCFCLASENITEKQFERLAFFKNNNNGFDIADYDLKMRGAGDMLGTRQHGEKSAMGINLSVYNRAQEIYEEMLKTGVSLEKLNEVCDAKYERLLKDIILN